MSSKSLPQWFSYIESLHAKPMALGLERIAQVAKKLRISKFHCPVITVAGTNGKGSCVAFLEAILLAAGYRVGAYTSPHLLRFNERIRIGGEEISDEQLILLFQRVELARGDITLTYFEFTTLAALLYFKLLPLDALILEVGLGGRLDAVNCVEPDVAVITTVALDHMDWLGTTREAIGFEKAGIFRRHCPAICGDLDPPKSVLAVAQELSVPLYCLGRDFNFTVMGSLWAWQHKAVSHDNLPMPALPVQNAATALMALQCLRGNITQRPEAVVAKRFLKQSRFSGTDKHYKFYIATSAKNWIASKIVSQRRFIVSSTLMFS